jgi:hypothetical protein
MADGRQAGAREAKGNSTGGGCGDGGRRDAATGNLLNLALALGDVCRAAASM